MAVESIISHGRLRARAEYKTTLTLRQVSAFRAQRAREYQQDLEALGGVLPERPRTYGDCEREGYGTRVACPWVGCGYHLALDVQESGAIVFWWPGRDVLDVPATCALAVVNRNPDGMTLSEVGELANITRERVRQIERDGLRALRALAELARIQDEVQPC